MKTAEGGPRPYRAAMTELADAMREARGAADVMDFFAGQLRGDPADLDGPELTALPTRSAVLRMLRRIDETPQRRAARGAALAGCAGQRGLSRRR